jgi:hypothetical protein
MGCVLVPALHQVAGHLGAAGTGGDSYAASGVALGPALLPILALVASIVAAVAVGSVIVAWLRTPEPTGLIEVTDPRTAGLLSVGFTSGMAAQRWLPATVVQLACDRVITIDDRRPGADAASGRPKDVRLVFGTTPAATERAVTGMPAGAASGERQDHASVVAAVFEPGMTGGPREPSLGTSVDVDRVVTRNGSLSALTRDRFVDAAEWFREPRPVGRFRSASIGGVLGIVLGLISLGLDAASNSIAWSAVVIGAAALGLRVLLPRWIPLNAAGLVLRERANQLREIVATAEVPTLASGEQVLPWAVLFDEAGTIRRVAEVAAGSGGAPAWYRSTEPFTADRLVSCLELMTADLSQPIRLGASAPWKRDGGRFGVPMGFDSWGRFGGWYSSDGGASIAGFGDGRFEYGAGDVGGGFDGGGFGGFDGGGGGDGGGGN